ncbi:hypothetical protein EJ04DRAFT_569387 [Polyplosphaeria fusca]|uniref:Xaa-Pro aminopeptidase n=1 Tax=Polyplosphaeria fusca TaxID=682080 RepID=A0A9P4QN16_9PLEO|nr:hypothetical protein EJ04DRAFT_569387 [Polyplosphaeria fusca]
MEHVDAMSLAERLRWEQQEYWMHLEAKSQLEKYPAKQHARRVQENLGVEEGLIYLAGEATRQVEDSDRPVPFRQRRYFYFLSGVNEADCHLTYDIQRDNLALFLPKVNAARVIYDGHTVSSPAEALDRYDIDEVFYTDALEAYVQQWTRCYKGSLYLLHESQNPLKELVNESINYTMLQPAMDHTRMIKDDHEIKMIRKANDISSYAHKMILANITKFKNEAQVEGLFLNVCISRQAKEQAYDPIAGSGPNAATLHYVANNEDFGDRQLMCLDAACEWECYAADITRTFPLSGLWPSKEAKDIYALVLRMQETCIERVKPGVRYLDLHILAHQIAIDGLLNLGLFHNGTKEEILKAGTSRAFFPHGLGHHVGLEVHDVGQGELMSLKFRSRFQKERSMYPNNYHAPVWDPSTCLAPTDPESPHLEEGMVVTIEPGIYFNTYLLNTQYLRDPVHSKYINTAVVKRYLPVGGVRLEDNILVTSKGYDNLTAAPKGEAMLEIIRSGNAKWPFVKANADVNVVEKICESAKQEDFEPSIRPSLYSGFSRMTTTDENVQRWGDAKIVRCQSPETMEPKVEETTPSTPVCGDNNSKFKHAYLDFAKTSSRTGSMAMKIRSERKLPACQKCTILVQTVDRLRQNLSKSESTPVAPAKSRLEPAASRRSPEIKQGSQSMASVRSLPSRRLSNPAPLLSSQRSSISLHDEAAAPPKDALQDKICALEDKIRTLEGKLSPLMLNSSQQSEHTANIMSAPRMATEAKRTQSYEGCVNCRKYQIRCRTPQGESRCLFCARTGKACISSAPAAQPSQVAQNAPFPSAMRPQQSMPDLRPQVYAYSSRMRNVRNRSEMPDRRSVTFDTMPHEPAVVRRDTPSYAPSNFAQQDYQPQRYEPDRQNQARRSGSSADPNTEVSTFMKKYGFERPPPIPTYLSAQRHPKQTHDLSSSMIGSFELAGIGNSHTAPKVLDRCCCTDDLPCRACQQADDADRHRKRASLPHVPLAQSQTRIRPVAERSTSHSSLRDQRKDTENELKQLGDAMDALWKVKTEVQDLGGAQWGDAGRQGRAEWGDRVQRDVKRAFDQ